MGDVVSLVERMQEGVKEDEARRMAERMMQNKFDYNDFLNQTRMLSRLGGLTGMIKMLPGAPDCRPCSAWSSSWPVSGLACWQHAMLHLQRMLPVTWC